MKQCNSSFFYIPGSSFSIKLCCSFLNQYSMYVGYFPSLREVVPVRCSWRRKTAYRELPLDKTKEVCARLGIGCVNGELYIT